MISLVVMTDGRADCLTESVASLDQLHGPITRRIIHDDSGDSDYRDWLTATFPQFDLVATSRRSGFSGAYAHAWRHLAELPEPFVFSTEDDFVFTRPVDLVGMMDVLDENPCLAQLALRRQPWNAEERAAGGIVEQHPGDYREMFDQGHRHWLEHRRFFTTNPSLFRRSLCERGWPDMPQSEGMFSHALFTNPEVRCGFWGSRDSGEWVRHIGHQRVGVGY